MKLRRWLGALVLVAVVGAVFAGLGTWKINSWKKAAADAAQMPEPMEAVRVAIAEKREYGRSTTTTGTVRALQSITLRNELAGTVQQSSLTPGKIVDPGTVLVALDVSVEEAELKAQEAQAELARANLERIARLSKERAVPESDLDRAHAERDIAGAQIARIRAVMARKTLRAPFRARVGMADLHEGQYLEEGTELTTLQGVDDMVHVDFQVTQEVAEQLKVDGVVEIIATAHAQPLSAHIVAIDAKVNVETRNAAIRAKIKSPAEAALLPGAAVRVRVPLGQASEGVAIPVRALRRGADGDFVFVLVKDERGQERASLRPVKVDALQNEIVLIASGLKIGERVAATGSFKLREGVRVAEAPAHGNGAPGTAAQAH